MSFNEVFLKNRYRYIGHLMMLIAGMSFALTMLMFFIVSNAVAMQDFALKFGMRVGTFGSFIAYLIFIQIFLILSAMYAANFLYKKQLARRWLLAVISLLFLDAAGFFALTFLSSTAKLLFGVASSLYTLLFIAVFLLFARMKKLHMG